MHNSLPYPYQDYGGTQIRPGILKVPGLHVLWAAAAATTTTVEGLARSSTSRITSPSKLFFEEVETDVDAFHIALLLWNPLSPLAFSRWMANSTMVVTSSHVWEQLQYLSNADFLDTGSTDVLGMRPPCLLPRFTIKSSNSPLALVSGASDSQALDRLVHHVDMFLANVTKVGVLMNFC
jgi:hypothetical protein